MKDKIYLDAAAFGVNPQKVRRITVIVGCCDMNRTKLCFVGGIFEMLSTIRFIIMINHDLVGICVTSSGKLTVRS